MGRIASLLAWVLLVASVALAPGAQAATFSGPTNFGVGDTPFAIATGNFNGDGFPDLAVANSDSDNVSILLADGSGGFGTATNIGVGDGPFSIAVGKFNADAHADLAVANVYSDNVSILLGNGSGGFTGPTNFAAGDFAWSVAVGTFNADAHQDLVVGTVGTFNVATLLGNGSGAFGAPTGSAEIGSPVSIAVGDLNGDSKLDLAVASDNFDYVSVLLGNGNGSFGAPVSYPTGDFATSVAIGKFNNDTYPDLAVANLLGNTVSILLGNGTGAFSAAVNYPTTGPYSVAVADFDGDSRTDVAVANYTADKVSVLQGDGQGVFGAPTSFNVGFSPRFVGVGDFNDDGRPDLVSANVDSDSVSVLLNTTNYIRPKTANITRTSLVPAYQVCSTPNRTHGPPLAFPSCNPPARSSAHLTFGTPDSNAHPLNATGTARYAVVAGAPGGVDDSDVNFDLSLSDVRVDGGTNADYSGELRASAVIRITDRANGTPERQATVTDIPLGVTVPCTPTGGAADIGATCAVVTSFDAVTPGAVPEGKRSVWELGKLAVYDGGADEDADTAGDNTLFAAPGIFVP
jgi:hypothetical protein